MSVLAWAGFWSALFSPGWQSSSSSDSSGGWVILAIVIGVMILAGALSSPKPRQPRGPSNPPAAQPGAPAPRRPAGPVSPPRQRPAARAPRVRLAGKIFIEDDPNLSEFTKDERVTGRHLKYGLGKDGNEFTPALMFAHVLPKERIASTRSGARYVVTISWGHQRTPVGSNTFDGICRVTVKERYNNRVIAREDFVKQTTQTLPHGFSGLCAGPLPDKEEISRFLKQMLGVA